jgi:hypothetical protein
MTEEELRKHPVGVPDWLSTADAGRLRVGAQGNPLAAASQLDESTPSLAAATAVPESVPADSPGAAAAVNAAAAAAAAAAVIAAEAAAAETTAADTSEPIPASVAKSPVVKRLTLPSAKSKANGKSKDAAKADADPIGFKIGKN